jgi:hypothetical protein
MTTLRLVPPAPRLVAPPDPPAALRAGLIVRPGGQWLREEATRAAAWSRLRALRAERLRALWPTGGDAA